MEDCQILFWPCRWINHPFTRLRVVAEGVVAVVMVASKAEGGCVPGDAVVDGEVGSGRVRRNFGIGLVWRSGGDAVICFRMPDQTKGASSSVVGGGVICWWRRTLSVAEAEAKR